MRGTPAEDGESGTKQMRVGTRRTDRLRLLKVGIERVDPAVHSGRRAEFAMQPIEGVGRAGERADAVAQRDESIVTLDGERLPAVVSVTAHAAALPLWRACSRILPGRAFCL